MAVQHQLVVVLVMTSRVWGLVVPPPPAQKTETALKVAKVTYLPELEKAEAKISGMLDEDSHIDVFDGLDKAIAGVSKNWQLAGDIVPSVALFAAVGLGFQDEWTRNLALGALGLRLLSSAASAFSEHAKGGSTMASAVHGLKNLALGGFDGVFGAAKAPSFIDREKAKDDTSERLVLGYLSSTWFEAGDYSLVMTMELEAKPGQARRLQDLLRDYYNQIIEDKNIQAEFIYDDPTNSDFPAGAVSIAQPGTDFFVLTIRFRSESSDGLEMSKHHSSLPFLTLTERARDTLAKPARLYLTAQRDGMLHESRYPFGPGGEGGRDDAIYSSPANLDGSQTGSKLGVEYERDIDLSQLQAAAAADKAKA